MSVINITPFFVDRAKGGRANCKGCKGNCPSGELRMAKLMPSPYGENQTMKSWHHVDCFLNALLKQRPTTKRVDSIDDIGNWDTLSKEDQEFILKKLNETEKLYEEKNSGKYKAKVLKNESKPKVAPSPASKENKKDSKIESTDDNKFSTFSKLCKKISRVDAYTEKTATVNNFFRKGTADTFKGDLALWCKLLLPQVTKRVYNLKSKQLVKLFSRIFNTDHDDMLTYLEQGDIADTIQHFVVKAKTIVPATESTLTIHEIEDFLKELSKLTKEEEQIYHFKTIIKKCTQDDLKMLIRLIKGDLRINAGPKHILEGIHPDAYTAFQTSRDLNMVLDRVLPESMGVKHKDVNQKSVEAKIVLMTPVLPMLAEACKSVEMAMKKCPNGMFSEIKYDGERVQVHKRGSEFKYFSRALKPVMAHKVSHFKDYLPQAFPKGVDMILDAEVLMVDVNTGKPLPFGTLGIHKKSEFKSAQVCLYVFDCLYYNGKVLIDIPIRKRREVLNENMVEVTNHVMFSEQELIKKPSDLAKMIAKVLQLGLEGLVLKDLESTYEPGKRHWLKVKKDYLFDGAMADTADLVVLGAWFGTGKKGGMMSVFLMGCLDSRRNRWVTVTKVHTGHDDTTLERLQKELNPIMVKISQDYGRVPPWLDCSKGMVPDFVARDPKKQPVWEITGTELTKANLHTADGISVRFPRVTKIRTDKNWESATNLDELKFLYKTSKEKTDVSLLTNLAATAESDEKKIKGSPSKDETSSPKKVKTLDSFIINNDKKNSTIKGSPSTSKNETSSPKVNTLDSFMSNNSKNNSNLKDLSSDTKKSKINLDNSSETHSNSKKDRKRKYKEESNSFENVDTETDTEHQSENIKRESKSSDNSHSSNDTVVYDIDSPKSERSNTNLESPSSVNMENTIANTSNHDSKREAKKRQHIDESRSNSSNENTSDHDSKREAKKRKHIDESSSNCSNETDTLTQRNKKRKSKALESENTIRNNKLQLLPLNPLPDAFKDKRLGFYPDFISFSEGERNHFERHWVAYGGHVIKSIRSLDVDYLVHKNDVIEFKKMQKLKKKLHPNVRHVSKNWIIKCINDVVLYDPAKYPVVVEP